jgi:hypothetical protein
MGCENLDWVQLAQDRVQWQFLISMILYIPWYGASSGCGWRRRSPDMESGCEYIEQAVANSPDGMVLQLGV